MSFKDRTIFYNRPLPSARQSGELGPLKALLAVRTLLMVAHERSLDHAAAHPAPR